MGKEKSCGAVVYVKKDHKLFFLVLQMNYGHYSLPKGHVEGQETEIETAGREIKEETNLDVSIDTRFREVITYRSSTGNMKDVVFFVAESACLCVKAQEKEIKNFYWRTYEKAYALLTYPSDKSVLEKAKEYLEKKK